MPGVFYSSNWCSNFSRILNLASCLIVGMQVLLARLQMLNPPSNAVNTVSTGLTNYKTTADGLMCAFLPRSPTASKDRTKSM